MRTNFAWRCDVSAIKKQNLPLFFSIGVAQGVVQKMATHLILYKSAAVCFVFVASLLKFQGYDTIIYDLLGVALWHHICLKFHDLNL